MEENKQRRPMRAGKQPRDRQQFRAAQKRRLFYDSRVMVHGRTKTDCFPFSTSSLRPSRVIEPGKEFARTDKFITVEWEDGGDSDRFKYDWKRTALSIVERIEPSRDKDSLCGLVLQRLVVCSIENLGGLYAFLRRHDVAALVDWLAVILFKFCVPVGRNWVLFSVCTIAGAVRQGDSSDATNCCLVTAPESDSALIVATSAIAASERISLYCRETFSLERSMCQHGEQCDLKCTSWHRGCEMYRSKIYGSADF